MPSSHGPIRRLGPADLKACLALSADREWPAEERKWALLLDAAEGYGIDDPDGGLLGAVVLARYGPGLASVGMMLVAARYGRQGLGHRLMTHLRGQAGRATVFLTATSYGRPLYEKLGFRTTGRSATFVGAFRPAEAEEPDRTRAASAADLGAIAEVDRPAFGADREYLLRRLFGFCDQIRVLVQDGSITGYAGAWPNVDITVIGPVIAPDAAAARTLITSVARRTDRPVRLDLDPDRRDIASWAQARGLPIVDETAFMVHGTPWPPGGAYDRLFCPLTVALG
jgi:GNAT superfamily N-acetyltransferase